MEWRRTSVAALAASVLVAVVPALGPNSEGLVPLPCGATVGSGTSANLLTLGSLALGHSPGELHMRGNLVYAASYNKGGFDVIDVSDPSAPVRLAAYRGSAAPALDVKLTADGLTALVGTLAGLDLVNVQNPAAPVRIRGVSMPLGPDMGHMLHDAVIGGTEYVFAATQSGSGVYIYRVTGGPADRDLVFVSQFAPGSPLGAHDMWVMRDLVLGKPLLYIANAFGGWIVADVSDPTLPVPLAIVPNVDHHQGYLHTVQAEWIEGRRIVVTMEEVGLNGLRVWDATTVSTPVLLATWSVAGAVGPLALPTSTSQHNIQIVDGRLYLAHYGYGFFVFDLHTLPTLPLTALTPIAHYAAPASGGSHWDVVLGDGLIYTGDWHGGSSSVGGLYVVQFGCITRGDAVQSSIG